MVSESKSILLLIHLSLPYHRSDLHFLLLDFYSDKKKRHDTGLVVLIGVRRNLRTNKQTLITNIKQAGLELHNEGSLSN